MTWKTDTKQQRKNAISHLSKPPEELHYEMADVKEAENPDRIYKLSRIIIRDYFDSKLVYNPEDEVTHLRASYLNTVPWPMLHPEDRRVIFVKIGGSSNEKVKYHTDAAAAYGIWFGRGSSYNVSKLLHSADGRTFEAAKLYAVYKAIKIVKNYHNNGPFHTAVLVIDSVQVVRGLTEWIFNDFKDADGTSLRKKNMFELIFAHIELLELEGKKIRFLLVDKDGAARADALADEALSSIGPE